MVLTVDIGEYFTDLVDLAIDLTCDALGNIMEELIGDNLVPIGSSTVDNYIGQLVEHCAISGLVLAALYNQYSDGDEWLKEIEEWTYDHVINYFDNLITYDGDDQDREDQAVYSIARSVPEDLDIRSSSDVATIAELTRDCISDSIAEMSIYQDPIFIDIIDSIDYPLLRVLERKLSFDDVITIDLRDRCVLVEVAE